MRSSISNSELRRATLLLFALLLIVLLAAELGGRLFAHVSRIQQRTEQERAALWTPASRPVLLLIGNSLLLEGIDFPAFSHQLAPRWEARRYVIEQTQYYDWLYGLRRLFREGVRPRAVVLGLNPPQLAANGYRGDYAARYLFDASDIPQLARDTNTDLTTATGLAVAHYSAFYALRSSIRQYILDKPLPGYFHMAQRFFTVPARDLPSDRLSREAEARLRELQDLCRQYGAQFLFTIPPTKEPGDRTIIQAGERAGVPVLAPIRNGSLDASYYRDEFHLNERGAGLYTPALASAVVTRLP